MEGIYALTVGVLFAAGTYMLLRRTLLKLVAGLGLISHGANLLVLLMGGVGAQRAPILKAGVTEGYADPLPQALILTAIVISFAVMAYMLILVWKTYQQAGTDDLDNILQEPAVD